MSRPQPRPTHIALPASSRSPAASPQPTPMLSPTSPRASFLGSLMRTRSRAATVTNALAGAVVGRTSSPTVEAGNPMNGTGGGGAGAGLAPHRSRDGGGVTRSVSTPLTTAMSDLAVSGPDVRAQASAAAAQANLNPNRRTYRIRLVPHLETSRSLAFDPVVREMAELVVPAGVHPSVAAASVTDPGPQVNGRLPALMLKIGRFTDRSAAQAPAVPASGAAANVAANGAAAGVAAPTPTTTSTLTVAGGGGDLCSGKVAFKSKVVSRSHAEIWCSPGGKFFIRDTGSSSGTFLNHIRLSSPNVESRPMAVKDGDVLQLGVDYQGGVEDMFRCIKMRVEIGRDWQRSANEFNTNALNQLKALGNVGDKAPASASASAATPGKKGRASVTDCCICLFSVTVCQSLFIAPCSHVFHYKCIRPLLQQHHPGFSCPLCRTFANLEEDVDTEDAWEIASRRASVISRRASNHSIRLPAQADVSTHAPGPEREPSNRVGFGEGTASVGDLLAASTASGRTSEEGGRTADDHSSGASGSRADTTATPPRLDRSETAVPGTLRVNESVGLLDASADDAEWATAELSGSLAALADPSRLDAPSPVEPEPQAPAAVPVPIAQAPAPAPAAALEAQTPMNETFLSTLAPSLPVHWVGFGTGESRLESAEEGEGEGAGADAHAHGAGLDGAQGADANGTAPGEPNQDVLADAAEHKERERDARVADLYS
ncbi:hypothetical protein Q5752_003035 [Cryptotrichosporon argae]